MRALFDADTPEFHGAYIDYSDVSFSPKPSVPLRIVVGGASSAAFRRAATLGDGWHGLHLSPEQVRTALATIGEVGRKDTFEISMRTLTRVGEMVHDAEPGTGLQGDSSTIGKEIQRYAAAGVEHLVIEPVSSDLDDFIEQMSRFARDIVPRSTIP